MVVSIWHYESFILHLRKEQLNVYLIPGTGKDNENRGKLPASTEPTVTADNFQILTFLLIISHFFLPHPQFKYSAHFECITPAEAYDMPQEEHGYPWLSKPLKPREYKGPYLTTSATTPCGIWQGSSLSHPGPCSSLSSYPSTILTALKSFFHKATV